MARHYIHKAKRSEGSQLVFPRAPYFLNLPISIDELCRSRSKMLLGTVAQRGDALYYLYGQMLKECLSGC